MADFVVHDFEFEFVIAEHLAKAIVVEFFADDFVVRANVFVHLLLNRAELFLANRFHVEIVVEAVVNRRADCRLGVWVEFGDCLRQKVSA